MAQAHAKVHFAEVEAYSKLKFGHGPVCIPRMWESGFIKQSSDMVHTYLVMDLLGPSVWSVFCKERNRPSIGKFFKVSLGQGSVKAFHYVH
eukprot:364930-Chlamydomonas_euryale.AAC.10